MTYEEKLDRVIKAIKEARKLARKEYIPKLYINDENLKLINLDEIHDILLQLQDDEEILIIKDKPTRLKVITEQTNDILSGQKDYFLIELSETFDKWNENYILKQKSRLGNLDWINLLKIYDICTDIEKQLQITRDTTISIPSFPYPYIGRFLDLFPYDSVGTRKSYQQHRWEGAQYLIREGVALEAKYDNDDVLGYGNILIRIDPEKFNGFYKTIKEEFEKHKKSAGENEKKHKTESIKIDPSRVKLAYNAQKGELDIEGQKVKLNKDSFRAKLLEILLKDDKSRKIEWSWDEVIEKIEGVLDEDGLKENKKKFYPACDGLAKFIAQKTGINDLLLFTKSTVQINPKHF